MERKRYKRLCTDRGGLGDEWDNIDDDIQNEIIETWIEIVKKELI